MKLNKCLKMIHAEQNIPSGWTIRFYNKSNYNESIIIPNTIDIDALYDDWYDECNNCPENGEYVFGITIAQESTGKSFLIEMQYEYTFEELMMEIENEFYKK